jgi:hypothetical protein
VSRKPNRVNQEWDVPNNSMESAALDVLQDIRSELQRLNALLHCDNFVRIPRVLKQIRAHTSRIRRPRPRRPDTQDSPRDALDSITTRIARRRKP